jgi:hypothetical protein
VQKFGGAKGLTKNVNDELKCNLSVEDTKVVPTIIDTPLIITQPHIVRKPKGKVKVRMVKPKLTAKKSRLDRATSSLYDLEDSHGPEKALNIDLGLYQMEDY